MTVKKGQTYELEIDNIAFGGRGIARIDGLAVFVDQAVPGDRVRARVVKKKKSYAEARVEELLSPSPDRVTPPCPYSGFCGGCKWQFLAYERQLVYKQQHVAEALERIGQIQGVEVLPTVASEAVFGYRNKMEFSCSDRRWLLPEEMAAGAKDTGFALGLHVPGTFHKVLDTHACLLQPEAGNRLLEAARRFIRESDRPPYGLKSHEGFWRFLVLRHSVARDQWMVNIVTAQDDRAAVMPLAEQLTADHSEVACVVNNVTARRAGVAVGESESALIGQPRLIDAIGANEFVISANSFFQTNTRGARRLYDIVADYAGLTGRETVVDLYCGTGTIAICLSAMAREVIGIELVESAVTDARENCRRNGVENCRFLRGDIKDVLGQIEASAHVMVIDPPRVGMHPRVVKQVLEMAPPRLVYVSCNPATLARDSALMAEHYRVVRAQPVDLFPHTFHIETVALLERL